MTPAEAQVLLGMAATVDNRKPDPTGDTARAWAALLDGLEIGECQAAVARHLRTSTEWLTPAHIRAMVLAQRRENRLAHRRDHGPLLPPPGLTNAEERDWERQALARISRGEVIDCEAAHPEPLANAPRLRELLAAANPTITEETP